jgi:hypothetical protein
VTGNLAAYASQVYVVRVLAGQQLFVDTVPNQGLQLQVTGANGTVLQSDAIGSPNFRGTVSNSQNYYLMLTAGSSPVAYTMTVTVQGPGAQGTPAPAQPTPLPTPNPQRIHFASGVSAASETGSLAANSSHTYVLRMLAGQQLLVSISPSQGMQLQILGADGVMLKNPGSGGPDFQGVVPSTQDYYVIVITGNSPMSYSMTVTVPALAQKSPQRIHFAPGTTSATVTGNLAAGSSKTYVLQIQAGQEMVVNVSPNQGLQLEAYAADGTVLKRGTVGDPDFAGAVPSTQDYYLKVTAGSQPVSYTMSVDCYLRSTAYGPRSFSPLCA